MWVWVCASSWMGFANRLTGNDVAAMSEVVGVVTTWRRQKENGSIVYIRSRRHRASTFADLGIGVLVATSRFAAIIVA